MERGRDGPYRRCIEKSRLAGVLGESAPGRLRLLTAGCGTFVSNAVSKDVCGLGGGLRLEGRYESRRCASSDRGCPLSRPLDRFFSGEDDEPMRFTAIAVAFGVIAGTSLPSATGQPAAVALPEIGVTYTHASIPDNCDLNGAFGLLKTYDWPGMRKRAQLQLAAMRAAGIDSIRILVWHLSEPAYSDYNNLPSEGGLLVDPYRTNLTRFATDVRKAGFKSLLVEYSPQW